MSELDIQEQIARINRELATIHNLKQETRFKPWQLAIAGFAAGASLLAAYTALLAFLVGKL